MNLILSPSFIILSKPWTIGGIEIYLSWVKSLLLNPCCCPSFSTFFLCFVLIFLKLLLRSWIICFLSSFGMEVMIEWNGTFYVMIMNMVGFVCLICTCFLTPKIYLGLNNSLTLPTPVFLENFRNVCFREFSPWLDNLVMLPIVFWIPCLIVSLLRVLNFVICIKTNLRGLRWSNFHLQDPIWSNKDVRLKSKKFFFYPVWDEKGIRHISDLFLVKILLKLLKIWLLNLTFLLVIEGSITHWWMAFIWTGFRTPRTFKKMSLIKSALLLWVKRKVPKHVYFILRNQTSVEVENKWIDCLDVVDEVEWNNIQIANFKCTIETQLRSFYFKLFHKAICTNQFLHRISTNCYFCNNLPETILHLFCECEKVSPLWDELCFLINNISEESFTFSNFEKNVWCHRPLRTWQLY